MRISFRTRKQSESFCENIHSGLSKQMSLDTEIIEVNERVVVAGQRKGTVRFIGEAQFAPGELCVV